MFWTFFSSFPFSDAFYTLSVNSFPPHKVEKKLIQTLKGLNVNITPRQNTGQPGPTLIIMDSVQESRLEHHVKDCWNLREKILFSFRQQKAYKKSLYWQKY